MKRYLLISVVSIAIMLSAGCGNTDTVISGPVKGTDGAVLTENADDIEKEEESMSNSNTGAGYDKEKTIDFLMSELGLNENRAKGAANILESAGASTIVGYENKIENKHAYSITLIGEDGEKYLTAFDYEGYIGPVKDENGNYLYAPVD